MVLVERKGLMRGRFGQYHGLLPRGFLWLASFPEYCYEWLDFLDEADGIQTSAEIGPEFGKALPHAEGNTPPSLKTVLTPGRIQCRRSYGTFAGRILGMLLLKLNKTNQVQK